MTHAVLYRPVDLSHPLTGRHGIVTGASRGIGRAIAIELARAGASVTIAYNEDRQAALAVRQEIAEFGGTADTDGFSIESHGPAVEDYDFLVNNAGITLGRSIVRTFDEDWDHVLDVNLTGTMRMTRAVLPGMIERGYGRIVNITSVVGMDGRLGPTSYAASKAGIVGFTKAAALELARKGVTVNAIAPGFIDDTGLLGKVPETMRDDILSRIPLGRWGRPEDVAYAALYLIAYGDYVTGTVMNVSGGWLT